jgi:hypothetical protein
MINRSFGSGLAIVRELYGEVEVGRPAQSLHLLKIIWTLVADAQLGSGRVRSLVLVTSQLRYLLRILLTNAPFRVALIL